MSRFIDITGKKFNKLTVIKPSDNKRDETGRLFWVCQCDCGNTVLVNSNRLKTGRIKSCGCLKKLPRGEASFNSLLGLYKRGAKQRGLVFDLTTDEFRTLTKGDCYFCGKTPSNNHKSNGCRGSYEYNGIDRIDNTKGYIKGNVVSCCTYCNRAKNNRTENEFLSWISSVFVHTIQANKAV